MILLQSQFAHLEAEKIAGTLEPAAYTARLNDITQSFLSVVGELER